MHAFRHMYGHTRISMYLDACVVTCVDTCIDMCTNMRTELLHRERGGGAVPERGGNGDGAWCGHQAALPGLRPEQVTWMLEVTCCMLHTVCVYRMYVEFCGRIVCMMYGA